MKTEQNRNLRKGENGDSNSLSDRYYPLRGDAISTVPAFQKSRCRTATQCCLSHRFRLPRTMGTARKMKQRDLRPKVIRIFMEHSSPKDAIDSRRKIVDWSLLLQVREQARTDRMVVVWTNGCFDILHVGHTRSLQAARTLGDFLVVGVNSDHSVRRLKGPNRPFMPENERMEIISALECVDYVIAFDELTPEAAIARLMPDIHCKGADYAPPDGKPIPEAAIVAQLGGRIEFLPMVPSMSTSELVRRIQRSQSPEK